MIEKQVIISSPEGSRPRPISILSQLACQFQSVISIEVGPEIVDAKSMPKVMETSFRNGEQINLCIDGIDEHKAALSIAKFFGVYEDKENRFGPIS